MPLDCPECQRLLAEYVERTVAFERRVCSLTQMIEIGAAHTQLSEALAEADQLREQVELTRHSMVLHTADHEAKEMSAGAQ